MIKRTIPSSGESLPVIGMGTYNTFDTNEQAATEQLTPVLNTFYKGGGRLLDSSPMYGNAERIVGSLTSKAPYANELFYATKVWTSGLKPGIRQMDESFDLMHRKVIDLMQVHNLLAWRTHLPVLQEWKAAGKIRYIGITHYTQQHYAELETVMRTGVVDFVQFNYSIIERVAEERLLSVAAELGVATLINRPLGQGRLIDRFKGNPLPAWAAAELDVHSWGAYLLKYVVGHPAVTCVIPASSNAKHMAENMKAGEGSLPDERTRAKMVAYIRTL
ncbi:aldo/keto reductase [Niastella yeongjuensis]|uniref:Aldo/keto reductase n=1 Tax=Niastella yeongjuensis TaxID=354355 RepID=A0A1V9EP72_9BACT|nr:aldo/keto reductase [Niastella yeongjuensis]OQP47930.1 aldo/keto reductase [Niastella yeongjuensis]SEP48038.1 Aldo/keto reductase [Niastella yeongjuensis]